jgi:Sel1 repeat-containing protein
MGYPADNLDGDSNPVPPWARHLVRPLPRSFATPTAEETRNKSLAFRYRAFGGDRAMLALQRQLALEANNVPVPAIEGTRNWWAITKRLCAVIGAVALIVWGIVALHPLPSGGHQAVASGDTPEEIGAKRVKVAEVRPATAIPTLVVSGPMPAAAPPAPTIEPAPPSSTHSQVSSSALASPARPVPLAATSGTPVPLQGSAAASGTPVALPGSAAASGMPVPLSASAAASGSPDPLSGSARLGPVSASGASASLSEPAPVSGASVPRSPSSPVAGAPVQPSFEPAPASAPSQAGSAAVSLGDEEIALLVKRGNDFLKVGDVSSARVQLRRAATAGSAEAAFKLGTTFDPLVLHQMGAIGIEPDVIRARQWYEKAAALGSAAASQQLANLRGR